MRARIIQNRYGKEFRWEETTHGFVAISLNGDKKLFAATLPELKQRVFMGLPQRHPMEFKAEDIEAEKEETNVD